MTKSLSITVPLTPPTGNMYVRHTRMGRHYVTREAKAFKQAVGLLARGQWVDAEAYEVEATVYLGAKQRGDVDNFGKVLLDALAEARVVRGTGGVGSDARVTDLILRKRRDRKAPRTELTVREVG
jgi:crossover junction endodeoxyribonuclease RusA